MPDMSKTEIPQGRERRKDIALGAALATEKLIQSVEGSIPGVRESKGWRDGFAEAVGELCIDNEAHANIDALTQIPNRRALYIRLDEEVKRANRFNHPLAVVMMAGVIKPEMWFCKRQPSYWRQILELQIT